MGFAASSELHLAQATHCTFASGLHLGDVTSWGSVKKQNARRSRDGRPYPWTMRKALVQTTVESNLLEEGARMEKERIALELIFACP